MFALMVDLIDHPLHVAKTRAQCTCASGCAAQAKLAEGIGVDLVGMRKSSILHYRAQAHCPNIHLG